MLSQHKNVSESPCIDPLTEEFLESGSFRIGLLCGQTIAITFSIVGNFFLVVYIWKTARFSQSTSSILILNLSICDLIRSTVLSPLKTVEYLSSIDNGYVSEDFCQTMTFFVLLLAFVGFHTVVAISQEHLLLICFPFKARSWLNYKTIGWVLVFIWLSAIAISLAFTLELSQSLNVTLSSGLTFNLCSVNFFYGESTSKSRGFTTFIFLFYYAIPVVVISGSYVKISWFLVKKNLLSKTIRDTKRSRQIIHLSNNIPLSEDRLRFESKNTTFKHTDCRKNAPMFRVMRARQCLAKMMLFIAVCFTIFNGPVFLAYLYYGWGYKLQRNSVFYIILFKCLPIVSSVLSPVVYCSHRRILRRNFQKAPSSIS